MFSIVVWFILGASASGFFQNSTRPRLDLPNLESRIQQLVNAERVNHKLPPLKIDERLANVARGHSADMARRNFFDHINPDGKNPTERGRDAKYTCRKYSADYIAEGLA